MLSLKKNPNLKFWKWFEKNSTNLFPESISIEMREALDAKIRALNVPGWEIGPFNEDLRFSFLAFSPMGDRKAFELTQRLVGAAPQIPGWVFLAAKPAKKWDRVFDLKSQRIHASKWKVVVYSYDDGKYDFVFIDRKLGELPKHQHMQIMVFLISSEIGELGLMKQVNALEYDAQPTADMRALAVELCELKEVLN